MGTNPKRTVTVQMVPQLAGMDNLGNKETNANWAKEPNLNLTPTPGLTSTDHAQENSCLTTANIQTASRGGEVAAGGTPAPPANRDQGNTGFLIGGDPQTADPTLSLARDAKEAVEGWRDDNANLKILTPAKEKDICKAALSSTIAPSKVDAQTNDCKAKGTSSGEGRVEPTAQPAGASAATEALVGGGHKDVTQSNQKPGRACESKATAPDKLTPQLGNANAISATTNKDVLLPLKSKEQGPTTSPPTQAQYSLQAPKVCTPETNSPSPPRAEHAPPGRIERLLSKDIAAVVNAIPPPPESKAPDVGLANKDTIFPVHPDLKPSEVPQIPLNDLQLASLRESSFTAPQAPPERPAPVQMAPEAVQASTGTHEQRQPQNKLYREASTMTASLSSTPTKQCQDVEVQAVANVCNRAVSTSPSLLPLSVPHRPSPGAVPREEAQSLAVVYQVDSGAGPRHLVSSHVHMGACPLPTSADLRAEALSVETALCSTQNAGKVAGAEAAAPPSDARLGAKPKEPGSSSLCNVQPAPLPLQPVYQINIEPCSQKDPAAPTSHHRGGMSDSSSQSAAVKPIVSETTSQSTTLPAAIPLSSQIGSSSGAAGVCPSKSDGNKALSAPPTNSKQAAVTPTPKQPIAEDAKPKAVNKPDSKKDKPKAVSKKEAKSNKQKLEQERKKGEESGKQKGRSVHDVLWDDQGMTWEVYGASVDPESLGFAIQSHLQCKIKEQEKKIMVQTSIRKSISAAESPRHGRKNKRRQNVFRSLLQNVRRPHCCTRPPPSSVLE
ncbi:uncharacterized protein gprin3b [Aplochiton taeniatus]